MADRRAIEPVTFDSGHVVDVMTWGVLTCPVDESRQTIARMLSAHRVHAVVVLAAPDSAEGERQLWGIVTDLDLMRAANEPSTGGAHDMAQRPAATVNPDDTLKHAAHTMADHGTSHLVVVDPASDRPVGIISSLDVAAVLAD